MNGNDVALDTSAAIRLLNDASLATDFLGRTGLVYLSSIAAGELLFCAANSARHQDNLPRFREFITHCAPLLASIATAEIYAGLRLDLKRQRTPIPDADIWIAASAIEKSHSLVTTDGHFSLVKGLSLFPLKSSPSA